MKIRITALLTAAVMLTALVSCGDKNKNAEVDIIGGADAPADVVLTDDGGPVLYLSNTEAEPGGVAEVTLSVKGADQKWNMCGVHVTYPDMLKCQMFDEAERMINYDTGDASDKATASIGMLWADGLPKELTDKNQGTVFFTEMFNGNQGKDGDIATFYFDVPLNAEKGTYPVGFYVMDSDIFSSEDGNTAFQEYAFSHFQEGSITIK